MRPTQPGSPQAQEAVLGDAALRIYSLFDLHPMLSGFTVDAGLCVEDVALDWPCLPTGAVGHDIAQAMLELLDEHPEAAEWLRGRTFARTLH